MRQLRLILMFAVAGLAVYAQTPAIVANGVLNAASFARNQVVAPGSLVAIFGTDLATTLAQASTIPFSTSLGGVSVTFNNIPAPLQFVAPGSATNPAQINAQIPWNVLNQQPSGNANVVVTRDGVPSAPFVVQLAATAPGVFSLPPGAGNAIAVNPDGTIAAAPGSVPPFTSRPVRIGETIYFYANGLGPVDSPIADGADSLDKLRNTTIRPTVRIDGIPGTLIFSGMAPQFPGVNQINVTIPQGVRSGNVPLQLEVGGITSTNLVTIAVQ